MYPRTQGPAPDQAVGGSAWARATTAAQSPADALPTFPSQVIHRADCCTSGSQRFRRNNQYGVITAGCLPTSDHEQVARDQRRREVLRSDVRGSSGSLRHSHCSHTFRRSFRHHYRETGPHGCDGGPDRRCRHRCPTQRASHDRRSINRGNHSRHYGMVCLRKRFPHRSHCCLCCSQDSGSEGEMIHGL